MPTPTTLADVELAFRGILHGMPAEQQLHGVPARHAQVLLTTCADMLAEAALYAPDYVWNACATLMAYVRAQETPVVHDHQRVQMGS